jgi:hypothetical protein
MILTLKGFRLGEPFQGLNAFYVMDPGFSQARTLGMNKNYLLTL